MPVRNSISKLIPCLLMIQLFAIPLHAQEKVPEEFLEKFNKQSEQIDQLLKNNELQEKEIQFLKKENDAKSKEIEDIRYQQNLISKNEKEQKLVVRLNTKYSMGYSPFNSNQDYGRYFISEIMMINLSSKPVNISKKILTLLVDGKPYRLKEEIPPQMKRQSIIVNNQPIQVTKLEQLKDQVLLPGSGMSAWVIFTHLPQGTHIPKMVLKCETGEHEVSIDINEYSRKQMLLTIEELGPKNTLGYLNISGTVNTVNIGYLAKVLDQMAAKQISRVVINWSESAQPLDNLILNWFKQASNSSQRSYNSMNLPMMNASIRELHLSNIPSTLSNNDRLSNTFHEDRFEAVQAALESAFEIIPLSDLKKEIKDGHPLVRAAAIATGGGRLPPEDLPMLLELADDDDIQIQKSALQALKHFGEEEALNKLIHYIRKNHEPLSTIATESLALSRYSLAQEFLLDLLKNEPPESKKKIVKILAQHPRQAWSEVIYQYASDPNGDIVLEALNALVKMGHPDLTSLLKKLLDHPRQDINRMAFNLLAGRYDSESVKIASDHALKLLETGSRLDNTISELLKRTKDQRAIPILLKKMDQSGPSRQLVIATLASIGDEKVAEELAKRYSNYNNNDKRLILNTLYELSPSRFMEIAKREVYNSDGTIVSAVMKGLLNDGSPESIELLINGYEKSKSQSVIRILSQALSTVGTMEARKVLYKSLYTDENFKKVEASRALGSIRSRSGEYKNGSDAAGVNNWKKAVEHFTNAINSDPLLMEAYSERGNAYLKLEKNKEAQADFIKATELNPYNSYAYTGIGTTYVAEGKLDLAAKTVEDVRPRFPKDPLFTYNSACVYSLACEYLKKQPEKDSELIAQYQDQALKDLKLSVDYGFNKLQGVEEGWMKKDPDLKTLHELPEFQEIINRK